MPGKGRPGGFKMPDEHRTKIANSKILMRLIRHAEGVEDMTQTQVTAALGLLKKCLPDLSAVQHTGEDGGPILFRNVYEAPPK